MQNKSNNIYALTHNARQMYNQLFAPTFEQTEFKQMPAFQLEIFLQKAIKQNLTVQLDFNTDGPSVVGRIHQLNANKFLITTNNQRFTKITNLDDIQAIQRV